MFFFFAPSYYITHSPLAPNYMFEQWLYQFHKEISQARVVFHNYANMAISNYTKQNRTRILYTLKKKKVKEASGVFMKIQVLMSE